MRRCDATGLFANAEVELRRAFPFTDYLDSLRGHKLIAGILMHCLPQGAAVLDFGCGPCDKAAIIAKCGYCVSACDDLMDPWHLKNDNRQLIVRFAKEASIRFFLIEPINPFPYQPEEFDCILLNDVIEHLHESPVQLLCMLLRWLKPNGLIVVTVPNAANLRKRLGLLVGRSNYPPYADFFWHPGLWRGHVREYVLDDLRLMAEFLKLELLELRGVHKLVDRRLRNSFVRTLYLAGTSLLSASVRDSLLLMARKPPGWNSSDVMKQVCSS